MAQKLQFGLLLVMRSSGNHRHYAFLALALLLATFVAALGGTSFQRKVESFQPLGFEAEARQGVWLVTSVTRPGVGVLKGDEIFEVNEQKALSFLQLRDNLRAVETSMILLRRGDDLAVVPYTRPDLEIDAPYLILAAIGILYLLIGLYTAFKDRQLQARLFYLWCVTSLALYLLAGAGIPRDFTGELIALADQLARTLLPALTLHLFLVFPTRLAESRWLNRLVPLVYLPAALSLTFHVDQIYGGQRLFGPLSAGRLDLVARLELFFLLTSAFLAVLMLIVRFSRKPDWENRRQVQWILIGMLGGYVPFLVLYVIPSSLGLAWPSWTTVAAVLPLALVPLTFAWAILKYKLLDIGIILRDSISYSVTILVGIFGFVLINMAIRQGVAEELTMARNFLTFAAGVVIAGVLVPARGAVSSGLEQLRFRGSLGTRRELARLGQELLHERDLDRLCALLIERLEDGLITRANLYLKQGGAMVPVVVKPNHPKELALDALGQDFWEREMEVLSGIHLPSEEPPARQLLFMAGYRYAFPLTVREQQVGVALVSYKFDEEPLNSEDLDLVRNLLNQASLAIENAQLLEEVHHQLLEVTRLEERNQGILESSPAGIVVLDDSDRVVSANPAFAVIAGAPRPDVVGKTFTELIPISPLPSPGEGLMEVSFCRPSGEEHYFQLSLESHLSGESLRVLIIQDISAQVAIEQKLKEKERLAALGMLAAGVAHEVNTPLTGISSYAQLLLADIDPSHPHYEILKKMERQTFRAAQIVNNLLEFARNRGDQPMPVQLDSVLEECSQMLGERAAEADVELDWQRPAEALIVLGHEGELHQVFTNLVVNALDAMGENGGRLTLAAEISGQRVRARVSDTGPGIPADRLERIFQPFFSSKLGDGGSGLGLAITANIVRRHGGEIRVENHTGGKGCTFTVDLPRHTTR